MWAVFGIIGLLILLLLAQAIFEGGMGEWVRWAFHRRPEGGFTVGQRLSQVFLISALVAFVSWWAGIAVGVFPVP